MKTIELKDLQWNPSLKIAKEWMLITAGSKENGFNTMTASWGQVGSLWGRGGGKPVVTIYIRPQRYTKKFVDENALFTLSFFDKEYQKKLAYLGSHSGKEEDKVGKMGLTPLFIDDTTAFSEANMIFVCKKLYHAPILESGFEQESTIQESYPLKDFHEMYIGEILKIYQG